MTRLGARTIPESAAGAASEASCSSDAKTPARSHIVERQYKLRLVTPMFGGGAVAGQIDPQMPIRASSIRGQLRFWWRMLHRGDFVKDGVLDVKAMRAREAEIWGSTDQPSAVQVRVIARNLNEDDYLKEDRFGFPPLSPESYALFSAIEGKVERIVKQGLEFTLKMSWPDIETLNQLRTIDNRQRARSQQLKPTIDDVCGQIDATVATWIALGGIGSRTRRGLGALEVVESSLPLPAFRLPPGAKLYAPASDASDAMDAWRQAVEVYQRFRQSFRGKKHQKTFSGGTSGDVPGRSHWPEPDAIREITGCALDDGVTSASGTPDDVNQHQHTRPIVTQSVPNFPRAVLGLPIGFHFAGDGPGKGKPASAKRDPATVELVPHATDKDGTLLYEDPPRNQVPNAGDRMASPIITKPIRIDAKWYAAVIVLPYANALAVNAILKGKAARWNAANSEAEDLQRAIPNSQIVGSHLSALCPPAMTDPMRGHSNAIDALIAFLGQPKDGANPQMSKPVYQERTFP